MCESHVMIPKVLSLLSHGLLHTNCYMMVYVPNPCDNDIFITLYKHMNHYGCIY